MSCGEKISLAKGYTVQFPNVKKESTEGVEFRVDCVCRDVVFSLHLSRLFAFLKLPPWWLIRRRLLFSNSCWLFVLPVLQLCCLSLCFVHALYL